MAVATEFIRNVVLVGHNGNGKTSLAEAMLYRAGVVGRPGKVDEGSTVCDSDPEEKERHQSLGLATATFTWQDHKINLIDTPGYADFVGEAIAGLYAADLAVFVIDSVSGVQSQDVVLWRHAEKLKLPRLVFVNGLDRDNSSFQRTLADLRSNFGSHTEPVELPLGAESGFHGIADLLTDHAFVYDTGQREEAPLPEEIADEERAGHEHLVEEVVEGDDEILEKYLEGTEPTPEQLEKLLQHAIDAGAVYPVLCGSATTPIAVDHLMTFICNVGPAPGDAGPAIVEAGGEETEVQIDQSGQTLAYVFKTRIDEFLGQISYVKVLSGKISTDDTLVNTRTRNKERLHQLISLTGTDHTSISEIVAGDIAAVAKLNDVQTGDTLAPAGAPVRVPFPPPPSPVYGVAVHSGTPAHEDRLATALRRLVTEDPSLAVTYERSTQQTILSGGGEAQIRVALSRIERAGIDVETEPVRVAYLETLARPVELESRYKKQSGGHGQFAVATVRFEPLGRGAGFEFDSEVTGGAIPRNLIPAVGAGIEESMAGGGAHGFPVVDLKAICVDGKHHSVDSSEMAFKMAGSLALKEAVKTAGTQVLEPISEIWVQVPDAYQGDVLGDLSSRRAQVLGTGPGDVNGSTQIHAHVPTSEIMSYAIDLRSMTGGTGTFEQKHHDYETLPAAMLSKIDTGDGDE
jgi:elongation factor G